MSSVTNQRAIEIVSSSVCKKCERKGKFTVPDDLSSKVIEISGRMVVVIKCLLCGSSWEKTVSDPSDSVNSDEVIEVHTRLLKFKGDFKSLLGPN